jgi:hypothetical protein
LVDKFVMDILHYTSAVSDCPAPTGIIIFGVSWHPCIMF